MGENINILDTNSVAVFRIRPYLQSIIAFTVENEKTDLKEKLFTFAKEAKSPLNQLIIECHVWWKGTNPQNIITMTSNSVVTSVIKS